MLSYSIKVLVRGIDICNYLLIRLGIHFTKKKRLLLFQPAPIHTEIFGFFIEFFNEYDIHVHYPSKNANSWIPFFEKLYNRSIKNFPSTRLLFSSYDIIVITTSEYLSRNVFFYGKLAKRQSIYIYHYPYVRKDELISLCLSPLLGEKFILPIFHIQTIRASISNVIRMMVVGGNRNGFPDKDFPDLVRFCEHIQQHQLPFEVILVGCTDSRITDMFNFSFVRMEPVISAEKLVKFVNSSHFILPIPKPEGRYYKSGLTGSLSLAISCRKPILATSQFANIYGLEGYLPYHHSLVDLADTLKGLTDLKYENLVKLATEDNLRVAKCNLEMMRNRGF